MPSTLRLLIVTPQGPMFSEDVDDGHAARASPARLGIYPDHVPLITQLIPGEIIVEQGGRERFLAVGGGLVDITASQVSILTDMAVAAENIDEARAEEARQRAAARLAEKLSDEEIASVNAALVRSLAQLQVKRRRHR